MSAERKSPPSPTQREWATFDRSLLNRTYEIQPISGGPDKIGVRPTDLPHIERDALGHFATQLRDQQARERRKARMSWYDIRFSDLMKLILLRLGGTGQKIPDGLDQSDVEDVVRCIGYHFQARFGADETVMWESLTAWCLANCKNWKSGWPNKGDIILRVLAAVRGRRRDLTAIEVGKALRLTWRERCDLGLRTIRPYDMTPGQFVTAVKTRKREIDRARKEAGRRKCGKPPRSEWLTENSKTRDQPWKHLDPPMSRAKFYRLKLHLSGETGVSRLGGTPDTSEQPVSGNVDPKPLRHAVGSKVPATSIRVSISRPSTTVETGGDGTGRSAAARLEDAAFYDALDPFGGGADQSQTKRRTNARQSAA